MRLLLCSLAFMCIFTQNCAIFGALDYLNSGKTIVQGLGKGVVQAIPKPDDLFRAPKQVLIGLPEVIVFKTINKLCSVYMSAETIQPRITPDVDSMSFRLRTPCKEITFPLKHAERILESPDFDVNKKLVVFVTGWMIHPEAEYITAMANAYNCRGNYTFLALDSADSIDTLYTWSAYNTEEVGRQLAVALKKLVQQVPVENIHLIGHSLGAHIVGYAGRYFTEITDLNLTRITGLDPANPCFNEGKRLSGLQRGDAQFVDIIHSNPGVLGKSIPIGDVDFYADGMEPIKPGCYKFGCSHGRAYEYFIESIYPGYENNFLATRCTSLKELKMGVCQQKKYPMGYAVPYNLKGNFFLSTNSAKPFGLDRDKEYEVPHKCGKCK